MLQLARLFKVAKLASSSSGSIVAEKGNQGGGETLQSLIHGGWGRMGEGGFDKSNKFQISSKHEQEHDELNWLLDYFKL